MHRGFFWTLLALAVAASPARAQSAWSDRAYVDVNAMYQLTATTFDGSAHPIDFGEAATVDTSYRVKAAPGFDVGGGVRLWRNLGIGVSGSRFTKTNGAAVDAQVPHPFYFNRARSVSGDASGLKREETAVHLRALWMIPATERWQIGVSGGPSWFSVRQDLVDDVKITQSYPYDTATFAGVASRRVSRSRIGFNAGADVSYLFARHVGVGADVRFTRARMRFPSGSDTLSVDAGGARLAAGLRLRF